LSIDNDVTLFREAIKNERHSDESLEERTDGVEGKQHSELGDF